LENRTTETGLFRSHHETLFHRKTIIEGKVEEQRGSGRPRRRWSSVFATRMLETLWPH